jgi:hypothetical protein
MRRGHVGAWRGVRRGGGQWRSHLERWFHADRRLRRYDVERRCNIDRRLRRYDVERRRNIDRR